MKIIVLFIIISLIGGCRPTIEDKPADAQAARSSVASIMVAESECLWIAPGRFTMGRSTGTEKFVASLLGHFESASSLDEGPPIQVEIADGFYLGKNRVTAAQYCAFLNDIDRIAAEKLVRLQSRATIERDEKGYRPVPGKEACAANTVPWDGATRYCAWLTKKAGRTVRLPTEAEWEFAARGTESRTFLWGNESLPHVVWSRATEEGPCLSESSAEATSTPTGLQGMGITVGEWTSTPYADRHGPSGKPRRGYFVLKRLLHGQTSERDWGRDVHPSASIYGFRILVE